MIIAAAMQNMEMKKQYTCRERRGWGPPQCNIARACHGRSRS